MRELEQGDALLEDCSTQSESFKEAQRWSSMFTRPMCFRRLFHTTGKFQGGTATITLRLSFSKTTAHNRNVSRRHVDGVNSEKDTPIPFRKSYTICTHSMCTLRVSTELSRRARSAKRAQKKAHTENLFEHKASLKSNRARSE